MEFILVVVIAAIVSALVFPHETKRAIKHVVEVVLARKLKPKVLPVQVPVKTLEQVHDEDHAVWLEEYKAILQRDCDHLYHNQNWYTCYKCGQDEPWEYRAGCSCQKQECQNISDPTPWYILTRRSPSCTVHGKDYKLMPVSDRKVRPFGNRDYNFNYNDETPYTRSKELTKGRSMKRLELPMREK